VSGNQLLGQSLVSMLQSLPFTPPVQASFYQSVGDASATPVYGQAWQVDVILVEAITDLSFGIAAVRMLTSLHTTAHAILLGADDDDASVYEAVIAGAAGYLTRNASVSVLTATLQGVMRGELGLSRVTTRRLVRQLCRTVGARARSVPSEVLGQLTGRQRQVFELVHRGLRNREIAEQLGISETTVCKHISNILGKLHVHSRTQAIAVAEAPAMIIPLTATAHREAMSNGKWALIAAESGRAQGDQRQTSGRPAADQRQTSGRRAADQRQTR